MLDVTFNPSECHSKENILSCSLNQQICYFSESPLNYIKFPKDTPPWPESIAPLLDVKDHIWDHGFSYLGAKDLNFGPQAAVRLLEAHCAVGCGLLEGWVTAQIHINQTDHSLGPVCVLGVVPWACISCPQAAQSLMGHTHTSAERNYPTLVIGNGNMAAGRAREVSEQNFKRSPSLPMVKGTLCLIVNIFEHNDPNINGIRKLCKFIAFCKGRKRERSPIY